MAFAAMPMGLPGTATLKVISPTPGQSITGDLPIYVKSVGYKFNFDLAGAPVLKTVGHYHIILDGKLVDMGAGEHDVVSMLGVAPGAHTLTLVPSNNNHMEVMSGAVMIPFTYAGPVRPLPAPISYPDTPTIAVASPASGAVVKGSSFDMNVNVANLSLSGELFGKDLVTGWGHWHVFVDDATMPFMKVMGGSPTVTVPLAGIQPGWHTFYAVLVDNQHMPNMTMPVMTSVDLYVAPSIRVTRAPSASKVTYKRKAGVAKYTLKATVNDQFGASVVGAPVYLQKYNTTTKHWVTYKTRTTSSSGAVSVTFASKRKSATSYRWYAPATSDHVSAKTGTQRVYVK
jgi:hypothetical protein